MAWSGGIGDTIYEDGNAQDTSNLKRGEFLSSLMEPEMYRRGQYYLEKYHNAVSDMDLMMEEWESINRLYKCDRDDVYDDSDDYAPNSFVPIMTPIIEGQTAAIVEPNMTMVVTGAGPGDQPFAKSLQYASEYIHKRDYFKSKARDTVRSFLQYGEVWHYFFFDQNDYGGRGVPRRMVMSPGDVLIDSRIKSPYEIQDAEYIMALMGNVSIEYARKEYGDEIADALSVMRKSMDFDVMEGNDDKDSFTLIHIWTRNNEQGNLQLIEMDLNGYILRESDPSKPYYDFVGNQYPFAFARCYKVEGSYHGFGDGRLLEPIQRTVNRLVDEIEIACRFNAQPRTLYDPSSRLNPDDWTSDPSQPIPVENPNQYVRILEGRGLSPVVENNIAFLMQQAQRATRFSDVMMGMPIGKTASATETAAVASTGSNGIMDKRNTLGELFAFGERYLLGLALEFWDKPFWIQLSSAEEYVMVDLAKMKKIPAMRPATIGYQMEFTKMNPDKEAPKYEQVEDDEGNIVRKCVEFDVNVSLGEGLPSNKLYMYNMFLSLAQLALIDETSGQPRPVLGYYAARKFLEQMIGISLDSFSSEEELALQEALGTMPKQVGTAQPSPMMGMGAVNPPSPGQTGMPQGAQVSMPPENLASIPGASRRMTSAIFGAGGGR